MASEKITAMIEEVKTLNVLELAELVHALEEEFGVSAAAAAVAAPAAGAAAAEEEKTLIRINNSFVRKLHLIYCSFCNLTFFHLSLLLLLLSFICVKKGTTSKQQSL